ncbi:MAG TPA: 4Fe-4S binding protein [Desulfomonilaceae bacterium]|nr:4Fe-4S binding protein [Desulfomonilaceae bacterium]
MKIKRNIIEIDEEKCDGCGQCIISCAEGALELVDGKVKLVAEKYCDGLGACLGECPTGALQVVAREAEDFDEEAVEHHLKDKKELDAPPQAMACGCPSAHIQSFERTACQSANQPVSQGSDTSALTHWPIQIRLVPPTAPFLKNADLLVAADCTPVAYPNFHRDFLAGKTVLMGCPKFDDAQAYAEKFAQIFSAAAVKSVTVLVMEVPCCSGLPVIVKRGMELAGKSIPLERIVISTRGEVLRKEELVA